jgi:5'(3')-deoxyribonucleotidase
MKCFLDIDDTISDTSNYVFEFHGKGNPLDRPENFGKRQINKMVGMSWARFWLDLPQSFWETIPKMPWADYLVEQSIKFFGQDNVYLLTSPIRTAACAGGKMEWVNKNYPKLVHNLIIAHPKWDLVGKDGILIDDSYDNQDRFDELGKHKQFYLFPSTQNDRHERAKLYRTNPELVKEDMVTFYNKLIGI